MGPAIDNVKQNLKWSSPTSPVAAHRPVRVAQFGDVSESPTRLFSVLQGMTNNIISCRRRSTAGPRRRRRRAGGWGNALQQVATGASGALRYRPAAARGDPGQRRSHHDPSNNVQLTTAIASLNKLQAGSSRWPFHHRFRSGIDHDGQATW